MRLIVILATVFFAAGIADAQLKPVPPPELSGFDAFIGEWSGEVSLGPAGPQQLKGVATFKFEKILDGLYIQMTLSHDLPGMGVVRGHTIYAWDPKEKNIRSHTFANGGMSDPSRPRMETGSLAGGALVMTSVDFKPTYVQTFSVLKDGTMRFAFQMDTHGNGKLADVGTGILRKRE